MLLYIYGDMLHEYPELAGQMFQDRARQFKDRLRWAVRVDAGGLERDEYDFENPLYVIATDKAGHHAGSMRLLPTTGPTMVNDHFNHLLPDGMIQSPFIWECTRFCLAPAAKGNVAAALMMAGGEVMNHFGVEHFVGVLDRQMRVIYRRMGAPPDIIGTDLDTSVGLWSFAPDCQDVLSRTSGISPGMSSHWFKLSFDQSLLAE